MGVTAWIGLVGPWQLTSLPPTHAARRRVVARRSAVQPVLTKVEAAISMPTVLAWPGQPRLPSQKQSA